MFESSHSCARSSTPSVPPSLVGHHSQGMSSSCRRCVAPCPEADRLGHTSRERTMMYSGRPGGGRAATHSSLHRSTFLHSDQWITQWMTQFEERVVHILERLCFCCPSRRRSIGLFQGATISPKKFSPRPPQPPRSLQPFLVASRLLRFPVDSNVCQERAPRADAIAAISFEWV